MIDGKTKVLGLIGKPVEHTLSPMIHNQLAKSMMQNTVYVPLLVEQNLHEAVSGAYALHFQGMNVTVPYKQEVLAELKRIDPLAERIGAVNTLVRMEGGYQGFNTDALGLKRQLESEQIAVENQHTVVLGAGGAAYAVVHLLADMGAADILILNRTLQRAEQLAERVNKACGRQVASAGLLEDYSKWMQEKSYLAVQCTSVGLYPANEKCVISEAAFYQKIANGVDLIYNPEETSFMKRVCENGGKACNGLKMLLYQAVISYELFTGVEVPEKVVQEIYERLQEEMRKNG